MNTNGIVAEIREGIAAGQYPYGSRLPGVRELAESKGVSQQTAAAAYAVLAALGLVNTKGGSGTVVTAGPSAEAHLGNFSPPDLNNAQAWRPVDGRGEASEATTLVRQSVASEEMADWGIALGTDVVERTRIRKIDGVPVQHKLTVLPYSVAAAVPEGYEGVPPLLAPVGAPPAKPPQGVRMADWLGWDVSGGSKVVITSEPMDKAACEALQMPEGSPGFRIFNVTRTGDGATVFVTVTSLPLHHKVTLEVVE